MKYVSFTFMSCIALSGCAPTPPIDTTALLAGCREGTDGIDDIKNWIYVKELSLEGARQDARSGIRAASENIDEIRREIRYLLSTGDQRDCWIIGYKIRNGYN